MRLLESVAFIVMCIFLLRAFARHTSRRVRIFLVSLSFIAIHLIHSVLSSEPLLVASGSFGGLTSSHEMYVLARDAELVVFYNLYVPWGGGEGASNAIGVVKDQMGQVSDALRRLEGRVGYRQEEKGVVFYNIIGDGDAFPPYEMGDLCRGLHPRLDCRRLRHYNNATESVTLNSLHEFCHSPDVKDTNQTRVAYLHSKGSYHDHGKQRPWRRALTDAALHPNCLRPPDDACNACGAQYYPVWGLFPGNMWTAKCSYVRQLLPPVEGGEAVRRREDAMKKYFVLQAEGIVVNRVGFHQDVFYGLDRYQWEVWLSTHPSLVPCELHSTQVAFWDMVEGKAIGEGDYDWGMGPRRFMVFDKPGERKQYLSKDEDFNFRQYYYLVGNLIKWISLYDMVPGQGSWVWDHFPAGRRWKELVNEHGTKAVDAMVQNSNPTFHSAFASSNHSASHSQTYGEDSLSRSNPPMVVFYQITCPSKEEEKAAVVAAIRAQFDVLSMGQYDHALNNFDRGRKILLYYTISGGSAYGTELVSQLCEKHSERILCRRLGTYNADFTSGETLRELHTFCKEKPSFDVTYITNVLSDLTANENSHNTTKVKIMTAAVTSKMCQPSKECNVCGAEFYPLPFLHFSGNMFSASCAFAQDLLPPKTFEEEMYNIAGDFFLAHLRKQFTTEFFKPTPRTLGLHRHSVDHWIGGHPDLKPCDVAPRTTIDENADLVGLMKLHSQEPAPRRGGAPPGFLDDKKERDFRRKREVAFREYSYLAGNVFRWHRLYGRAPGESDWAWEWFSDGRLWEVAARKSGAYALREVARQLGSDGDGMDSSWVE